KYGHVVRYSSSYRIYSFFFSSRRRHTRSKRDWSSDVCSSDLYPNETAEQFEETLTLYDEVAFEHAYTYIYSQRDGTPAAKMKDNVPLEEKKSRLQQLNKKVRSEERRVGKESRSRRSAE